MALHDETIVSLLNNLKSHIRVAWLLLRRIVVPEIECERASLDTPPSGVPEAGIRVSQNEVAVGSKSEVALRYGVGEAIRPMPRSDETPTCECGQFRAKQQCSD
jgi:hypothetical protein